MNSFLFLFHILLFSGEGLDVNESITSDQLHYMRLLEEYLLIQLRGDRKLVAIGLGTAGDLKCHLQY